jgi:hypothetical protein
MRRNRLTCAVAAASTLLAVGLSPAAALAGSLLSGYGGPGQGNQAILGSALLNGPAGKGGSGGGGSSGASGASARGGSTGAGPRPIVLSAGGAAGEALPRPVRGQRHPGGAGRHASASGSQPYTRTSRASEVYAAHDGAGGSPTLGISGADLLYILLALGTLVLTGVLTRRLARQPT